VPVTDALLEAVAVLVLDQLQGKVRMLTAQVRQRHGEDADRQREHGLDAQHPAITLGHTSKAALQGLLLQVAKEGAALGVRVNAVAPGLMDTALGVHSASDFPQRTSTPVPLGRMGTAWEVAYPVVSLLSSESSYVTAQTLLVDGGLTALRQLTSP
jgi:NAD(P)-dependent dehydrogenase (short-subunit alcohol dehydrogenase family)